MDLGVKGRKAIVCASSRGLGKACATALAEAGCAVTINGRDAARLAETAKEIRAATGAEVVAVAGDLDDPATRDALFAACPEPDILVNNNGGPPPAAFVDLTREMILAGLEANMLTPIALIQRALPGMAARRFGRIVNITSSSVRAPLAGLDVSSGARAGPDRLRRRQRARLREAQRHHQFDPARRVRHRPHPRHPRQGGGERRRRGGCCGRGARPRSPPAVSAGRRNSARCARSSPAPRPATSPARTS